MTMEDLYNKLDSLGFSKEFIRAIGLPSWWIDELDKSSSSSVVLEAAGHISKRLFLDLKSLIDINQKAKFKSNMSYERTIYALRQRKKYLLKLKRLGVDVLANDVNDYFEQLLFLKNI